MSSRSNSTKKVSATRSPLVKRAHSTSSTSTGDSASSKSNFTVSHCNVGSAEQRGDSSKTPRTPTTCVYPLRPKTSHSTDLRLSESSEAIREEKLKCHQAFLQAAHRNASMLCANRHDQQVAVTMLVEESWRYSEITRRSGRHKAGKHKGFAFNKGAMKDLLHDVRVLMTSDVWETGPNVPCTVEKHPYLFTVNEIHQLKLFASTAAPPQQ